MNRQGDLENTNSNVWCEHTKLYWQLLCIANVGGSILEHITKSGGSLRNPKRSGIIWNRSTKYLGLNCSTKRAGSIQNRSTKRGGSIRDLGESIYGSSGIIHN